MTVEALKTFLHEQLKGQYPSEEIDTFFFWLAECYLGYSKVATVLAKNTVIPEEKLSVFKNAIIRLKQFEPIQYITGETEFYGLPFLVNKYTLIPRPETEELVSWILEKAKATDALLDVGTGSGCIAIALAKQLSSNLIEATDISSEALAVAQQNAVANNVNVYFFQQDILTNDPLPKNYEIMVSNPPYVRLQERKQMQQNVLDHEPPSALFVSDEDPLLFYRAIAAKAKQYLVPNGLIFFEINEYLGKEMVTLLEDFNFKNIVLKKDLFGKDRMICATHHG